MNGQYCWLSLLTHWDPNKIAVVLLTTFSNSLFWMEIFVVSRKFVLVDQIDKMAALVKTLACTKQRQSHYLNRRRLHLLMHIEQGLTHWSIAWRARPNVGHFADDICKIWHHQLSWMPHFMDAIKYKTKIAIRKYQRYCNNRVLFSAILQTDIFISTKYHVLF